MGTRYFRVNEGFADVGTTRYITVATSPATQIVLTSGFTAMIIFNHGTSNMIWGDSNISVNSGNYHFVNGRIEHTNLQDGWSTYYRADSVNGLISISEYGV